MSTLLNHHSINRIKLPSPLYIVQKGSEIVAIVVRRVGFSVVGRGERRHFVSIYGVEAKKPLHLLNIIQTVFLVYITCNLKAVK